MKSHGYEGYITLINGDKLFIKGMRLEKAPGYQTQGYEEQVFYLYVIHSRTKRNHKYLVNNTSDNRNYIIVKGKKYYEEQWHSTLDWDK